MNVGDYIKELRLKRGMTLEELGAALGVQKSAVHKWECGMVQNLKRETIKKLANVFDVPPSSFIDNGDDGGEILTPTEQDLIDKYRALPDWMQRLARDNLNALYREKIEYDRIQKENEA